MRYLYYLNSSIQKTATGELLDDAQKEIVNGNDVAFLICGGLLSNCPANRKANAGTCKACKLMQKLNFNLVKGKYEIFKLSDYCIKGEHSWEYSTIEELRAIHFEGIRIGISMMSSYIEYTRNLTPLIDDTSRKYFDMMLTEGANLVKASKKVISKWKPDKVILYNGRHLEARPIMDICLDNHIEVEVMELIETSDVNVFYPVKFCNTLPHSIAANQKVIEEVWDKSSVQEEEKRIIGESFYLNRRNKKRAGDKIYTLQQKQGELPCDWDDNRINIAIFNSSEDEFAGLGDEWDSLKLFKDQMNGIKLILRHFKDNKNYHFYLRIHPNLKNVRYKYHTDLYQLPEIFNNVTVISAADSVDTYQLMDRSEKIIVFGSTMGIESAFWEKPVILLGPSVYYYTGVCYTPHSEEELYNLLKSPLKSLKNDFVYKYGYRIMNSIECSINSKIFNYIDFTGYSMRIFGRFVPGMNYQKLCGSRRLFLLIISAIRTIYSTIYKDSIILPNRDE